MPTTKPTFAVLGPQPYMARALEDLRKDFDLRILNAESWEETELDRLEAECRSQGIEAVGGFAQKDAFHHILINDRLGNAVPSRLSFLYCMNKYLMRTLEAKPFWFCAVSPMQESDEEIIEKIAEWPFFLKNTSLSLGRGIFKIDNPEQLVEVLAEYRQDEELQKLIRHQNDAIMAGIPVDQLPEVIPPFIAEHMVDSNAAVEYCYEGCITPEGEIVPYALTEEVYFRNHNALGYITPPMGLKSSNAAQFEAWVNDYMGRLSELGYRNQFFNLEMWMIDGELFLTEINPRAAHTYYYNYAFSYGHSLYKDNLLLARDGKAPEVTPWQRWKSEDFQGLYTLIVLITAKQTGRVGDILDYEYIRRLESDGILIRHVREEEDILKQSDMTAGGAQIAPDLGEIEIRKTHSFDLAGAQQVADDLARDLGTKFDVKYHWDGDVIVFERAGCHGEIEVDAERVHVHAKLGFFLSYLKPAVEREINRYLDEHFVRGNK